jgi:hypothetical protein
MPEPLNGMLGNTNNPDAKVPNICTTAEIPNKTAILFQVYQIFIPTWSG